MWKLPVLFALVFSVSATASAQSEVCRNLQPLEDLVIRAHEAAQSNDIPAILDALNELQNEAEAIAEACRWDLATSTARPTARSTARPVWTATPGPIPTATPRALTAEPTAEALVCPTSCATALALGWSDVEAGRCSNLDRDRDGVACYGD